MSDPVPGGHALVAAAERLLKACGDLRAGETLAIVTDTATRDLGELLADTGRRLGARRVEHLTVVPLGMHGAEPPAEAAEAMARADLVCGLTRFSMAHTEARRAATDAGARYMSLPDYDASVLAGDANTADFRALGPVADRLAALFTSARRVHLRSAAGTDLVVDVTGRTGNSAPGWCAGRGSLASPPDAEANVAPVEDASEGVLVVDGSIPHPAFGPVREPLRLRVEGGRVVSVEGPGAGRLEALFATERHRVVAELGVGLNPKARLTGRMLEDEGCAGTAHIGLGSNAMIGGRNRVPFHLDLVMRDVRLFADGAPVELPRRP